MRLINNNIKYLFSIFHIAIIAGILLSGCGYKGDPYYSEGDAPPNKHKEKLNHEP